MTGPRRATAPPLRLRLRSGTAARHTISYQPKDRKPDGGWGHFKPSRWGQCKPSLRTPEQVRTAAYQVRWVDPDKIPEGYLGIVLKPHPRPTAQLPTPPLTPGLDTEGP